MNWKFNFAPRMFGLRCSWQTSIEILMKNITILRNERDALHREDFEVSLRRRHKRSENEMNIESWWENFRPWLTANTQYVSLFLRKMNIWALIAELEIFTAFYVLKTKRKKHFLFCLAALENNSHWIFNPNRWSCPSQAEERRKREPQDRARLPKSLKNNSKTIHISARRYKSLKMEKGNPSRHTSLPYV